MTTTIDPRGPLARDYRNNRRDGMTAQAAIYNARAKARGWELATSDDRDHHARDDGGRQWTIDLGAGMVVRVEQIPDQGQCDCWDCARDNPRDDGQEDVIPNHDHFGIVATATMVGREVLSESCWGFIWNWPGQDDYVELADAWGQIADDVIERAGKVLAATPEWVRLQMAAWKEES